MEAFYEESAKSVNSAKEEKNYKTTNVISYIFLAIGILGVFIGISYIKVTLLLFWAFLCLPFFVFWFIFYKLKYRYNVSYDYCFVSGELRISKVFNFGKRKGLVKIDVADIIQIGDVDNGEYERFSNEPNVKTVVCTPNSEPSDDKFFMYMLVEKEGKTLYLLECRELLLMNIMKFAKRSALERGYVMQEKKQKKI